MSGAEVSTTTLNSVFGELKDVGHVIDTYNFDEDDNDNTFLHVDLAPTFGDLSSDNVKDMDLALKVMIAGTMRALESVPPTQRTWEKVMETLMQCPILEPHKDEISRADKLLKSGYSFFKIKKQDFTDDVVVREVMAWFTTLIQDQDVLRCTRINIKIMAGIVAKTGAAIEALSQIVYNTESQSKTIIDIGVLRFPDITHPYFKVYRIKLEAWSQSKRVVIFQENNSGITGEFHSRKFMPRSEVIDKLTPHMKDRAAEEAEALFSQTGSVVAETRLLCTP